jgi:hypothetical protein
VNVAEFTALLREPSVLEEFKRALGLPSEPVAVELRGLGEAFARQERRQEQTMEAIDRLTQAQARADLRLSELARRTDERFAEMAEAQRHTDQVLADFARRTEERFGRVDDRLLNIDHRLHTVEENLAETARHLGEMAARQGHLDRAMRDVRSEVGGLSQSFGFWVEDIVAADLPDWLEQHHGVRVEGLQPDMVTLSDGRKEEVDGLGRGVGPSGAVIVVCEAKSRIWPREVEEFRDKVDRLAPSLEHPPLPVLVGYSVQRSARVTAAECRVLLVATREFRG